MYNKQKRVTSTAFFYCINSEVRYIFRKYESGLEASTLSEENAENGAKKRSEGIVHVPRRRRTDFSLRTK
jgi:hypothetical protein